MLTEVQIIRATGVPKARLDKFYGYLVKAMEEFEINTPLRQAAFLSQVFHESGNLRSVTEGLYYRPETLMRVWPSRFKTMEQANKYARSPERLANHVYANRMGNGDEASGDGYKFRGAGLIQLTGKNNHLRCGLELDLDLLNIGDDLRTPEGACRSAAWFWHDSEADVYADKGDIDGVSDVINRGRKTSRIGDAIGYAHRLELYNAFKKELGVK